MPLSWSQSSIGHDIWHASIEIGVHGQNVDGFIIKVKVMNNKPRLVPKTLLM